MTTEKDKRPRGRPRGSGKDDTAFLNQVVDLLVRNAAMKPTTAMKRVIYSRKDRSSSDETLLRRLQVKWKAQGEPLLVAARERAKPPAPRDSSYSGSGYGYGVGLSALYDPYRATDQVFAAIRRQEELERRMMMRNPIIEALEREQEQQRRALQAIDPVLSAFERHRHERMAVENQLIADARRREELERQMRQAMDPLGTFYSRHYPFGI